jgi:hypothetical protein
MGTYSYQHTFTTEILPSCPEITDRTDPSIRHDQGAGRASDSAVERRRQAFDNNDRTKWLDFQRSLMD